MIRLIEVNAENFVAIAKLSTNEEGLQGMSEEFVMSNLFSIAQLQFLPGFIAQGVYLDDKPIGFVMYGLEGASPWIYRFMIDYASQGQGLGKQAMAAVVETIESTYQAEHIMISFEPENDKARKLYEHFGFKNTGRIEEGELVFERSTNVV